MRFRSLLITISVLSAACACLMFTRGIRVGSAAASSGNSRTTSTYRVTLVGFKVVHESDDDILEGDGRGDEIYIRWDNWTGTATQRFPNWQTAHTAVMGDTVNHPERVRAGSSPPRVMWPGDRAEGIRTGDSFPVRIDVTHPPTVVSPGRLPTVLWQGQLTDNPNGGNNEVVAIAPSVWEWDSSDQSYSERVWPANIQSMFTNLRPALLAYTNAVFTPRTLPPTGMIQNDFIVMGAGHKAGTRPIGWKNNHPPPMMWPGAGLSHHAALRASIGSHTTFEECVIVPMLILTATRARDALAHSSTPGLALFEMPIEDQYDHGSYVLFLVLERMS